MEAINKITLFFVIVLLIFASMPSILFVNAAIANDWTIETVDDSNNDFWENSIALDNSDNPHICYHHWSSNPNNEYLKYGCKINDNWDFEIIDDSPHSGHCCDIAVDNNNIPHVCYQGGDSGLSLYYATKNGNLWITEEVHGYGVASQTSIDIDSNNNPHIAFYDCVYGALMYAHKENSEWNVETVDSLDQGDGVGQYASIAVDYNNIPHISYHDSVNHNLKYAKKDGGSWDIHNVDYDDCGYYSSIDIDSNNNPHISFSDSSNLKYTFKEEDFPDNIPPTAYIDSISPNPADEGETVSFSGHGTDTDGTLSAYNWRSSIDGQLSTDATFTKSDLSTGSHTIYFKVKDNDNIWSTEKSQTLVVEGGNDDPGYVPVWSVGNEWNYNFNFEFLYSGVLEINGAINPMKLEVINVNEEDDEYELIITGYINADLTLFGFLPGGGFSGDVKGDVKIDKSTLAMKEFNFEADGSYLGFGTHAITTMSFNPSFDIFDFPIEPSEDANNPWTADTFSELCIDFWAGSIHQNACIDGGFDDEELHYVREEFHNGYDCILFSGNMGPSHGGSSKLWYSEDAGYLVDIQESIYEWEGVDATLNMPLLSTNYDVSNYPPVTPDKPTGETTIFTGDEYTFTASTEDDQGDLIYYMFDWGDSQRTDWLGPYVSEQCVSADHIWLKTGSYNVRVKAKDESGLETSWSDPLVVTVNSETPVVTVFIHRFDKIDEIDYPYLWDPIAYLPEWYYRVRVKSTDGTTSDDFYYCTQDGTKYSQYIPGDGWQPDREHDLVCTSPEVIVSIKAMDHDEWYEFGNDIWDISGCTGDGEDNSVSDSGHRGAIYHGTYNLITDSFKPFSSKPSDYADKVHNQNGYLVSSGEYAPDSSTGYDGNDAKVEFWVSDSYDSPTASITDAPAEERVNHKIDFIGGVTGGYATKEVPYDWSWDFGDGSTSTKQNPSHTYSSTGTYTVTLTVTDGFDQTDTAEITINIVVNSPPNKPDAPSGPPEGKKDIRLTYTAVTTDPEEDKIQYKFDWDDGTYSSWTNLYSSGQTASATHEWDHKGTYQIRVKARDEYGDESEWSEPMQISLAKQSSSPIIINLLQKLIDMFPVLGSLLQPILDNLLGEDSSGGSTQPNPI